MQLSLYLKSLLIGPPFEKLATRIRWLLGARNRASTPELWEVHLEPHRITTVLKKILRPDSNCVDVGCHVGAFLSLVKEIAPNGQHTAVEADPTKAAWLKLKFPDVKIFAVAVGEKAGFATFEENVREPGCSHLQDRRSPTEGAKFHNVEVRPLDDIVGDKVDLIKMDILGAELAALRGATATIERWKPVILMECGSARDLELAGLDRQALFNFLTEDLGYDVFFLPDFIFGKGRMSADEFRKSGIFPFRAFNYLARPRASSTEI
jgi:FkbM family methyltransferase